MFTVTFIGKEKVKDEHGVEQQKNSLGDKIHVQNFI